MEADMSTRATAEVVSIIRDGRMAVSFRAGVEGLGDIDVAAGEEDCDQSQNGLADHREQDDATDENPERREYKLKDFKHHYLLNQLPRQPG